jgi:hypothetical protein
LDDSVHSLRPLTLKARRRSWNEPFVRGWWLSTVVLIIIIVWIFTDQMLQARHGAYRLGHWKRIDDAKIEKIGIAALTGYYASAEVLPDMVSTIGYTDSTGTAHHLAGYLKAQTTGHRPGDKIPILVNPDNPDDWTDRVTPLPLVEQVMATLLLLPLPIIFGAVAIWQRQRVLAIWRKGVERTARVISTKSSAASPRSLVLQCSIAGNRDDRLVGVTVPRSVGRYKNGDVVSLLTLTNESGRAIATELYA